MKIKTIKDKLIKRFGPKKYQKILLKRAITEAKKRWIQTGKRHYVMCIENEYIIFNKQTNDGAEAKKLVDANNKLIKSNLKLKEVKTASVRVNEQILKANAKLAESRTKEAQQLALVRQKILQQNKALRDNAKATLGLQKRIRVFLKILKKIMARNGLQWIY